MIYRKSCETTTTPPWNALMASARESMVGMSRPLVGSSSRSMLGPSMASRANTIRDFYSVWPVSDTILKLISRLTVTYLSFTQRAHECGLRISSEAVFAELLAPVLVILTLFPEFVTAEIQSALRQVELLCGMLTVKAKL